MGYKDLAQKREYQRKWKAERRARWLAEHGPCAKCGSTEDLEVDHIDSSEKVSHKVWSWSAQRREAELAKCQVLCRECHLKKSRANGEQPAARQHGTRSMYEAEGCRCDPCRKAHTDFQREWRQSRRAA